MKVLGTTNDYFPALEKHYVTVIVKAERKDPKSEPQVCRLNQIFSSTASTIADSAVLT
jgi:hypothetical protein